MNIPKYLEPINQKREDVTVPIDNPRRELTAENLNDAFEQVGLPRISGDQAKALRDLGIQARALGILETMQGTVLLTQQGLCQAIIGLSNRINEPGIENKEFRENAKLLGDLSVKLAKLNSSAIKNENVVVEARIEEDKKRRASFAPGRQVREVIDVKPL